MIALARPHALSSGHGLHCLSSRYLPGRASTDDVTTAPTYTHRTPQQTRWPWPWI